MAELRFADGVLSISDGRAMALVPSLALILLPDGSRQAVDVERFAETDSGATLEGAAAGFGVRAAWRRSGAYFDVELGVHAQRDLEAAVRVELQLPGLGTPRWMIPGCFYGENRLEGNRAIFPRWDPSVDDPNALVSSSWAFRADRAAVPAIMAWTGDAFAGLCTDERGPAGPQGIGFRGTAAGDTAIWIDAPYREEPVRYADAGTAGPPVRLWHAWREGEQLTLRFSVAVSAPDAHAYAPFLRAMHAARVDANPLNPWLSPRDAAELGAEGLMRWHYDPEQRILIETAAFDREAAAQLDRRDMHVAWVSGAPTAYALLRHGRRSGDAAQIAAATSVLDTIASGLAPCGAFWGEWRDGRGWAAGWNANPEWLHARTLGEATLFMLRALRDEPVAHPAWEAAIRSNLRFVVAHQREDGNLGAYYHAQSGEVVGWSGAGGLPWIAALTEAASQLGEPLLLAAAQRAGGYYAGFVEDELIYGAPEDVHLTPTSEDGYNALIAYMALHAAMGGYRWLELARRAADWTLTFRYAYNIAFPPDTLLGAYDFRTRGGDLASPPNQHLHAYGLVCLPELFQLADATADAHYRERAEENLACFLQFVARRDGDFNARRGMVSERFYQTDWAGPKGGLLTLSHAWSIGLLLYACAYVLAHEQEPG